MKKTAFISDLLFAFFVAFLFALCLFRHLAFVLPLALALAAAVGFVATLPVYARLRRKRARAARKAEDETNAQKLLLHLALSPAKQNAEYFRALFTLPDFLAQDPLALARPIPTAQTPTNTPTPETAATEPPPSAAYKLRLFSGTYVIDAPAALVFPIFTMRPADGDLVAAVIRQKTPKQKLLLCSDLTKEARSLSASFGIRTQTGAELYALLKEYSFLPARYEHEPLPQPARRERKKRQWFKKSNSRRFLIGGVMILALSYITPFPRYYIAIGTALLAAATLVRIFGYR